MANLHFFKDLKSFPDFREVTGDRYFVPVPDGWCIIVTDVVSSTQAIESGRYKDVNTIGAASIVAIQNALKGIELPFCFGGDGAAVLVPKSHCEKVYPVLNSLRNLAADKFDLSLRIGLVDMEEITEAGDSIEVAKFEISSGKCIAVFRGGGLSRADAIIKADSKGDYHIPDVEPIECDLNGLSCRWQDVPSRRGKVLSLIVHADGEQANEVYLKLINKFDQILSDSLSDSNPVSPDLMKYRSLSGLMNDESRYHSRMSLAWVLRVFEILAAVAIFRYHVPPLFFNPRRYAMAMRSHSDYMKLSDRLQMVIDCSPDQEIEMISYLSEAKDKGELFYGFHKSDNSLMTCYVHDLKDGNHLHFIDGGGGGYALASKGLKAQMSGN